MEEKPKVVINRTRRSETAPKDFNFTENDLAPGGAALEFVPHPGLRRV